MGIIKRQSIKTVIVSYAGVLIGYLNNAWFFPWFLDPIQIGLIKVLQQGAFLIAQLGQLGAPGITIKFFPYFRDLPKQHNGYLFSSLLYTLTGFVLVTALFLIFKVCFAPNGASLKFSLIMLPIFSPYGAFELLRRSKILVEKYLINILAPLGAKMLSVKLLKSKIVNPCSLFIF